MCIRDSLCSTDTVDSVKSALTEQYYNLRFPELTAEELEDAIIISKPSLGSVLYE